MNASASALFAKKFGEIDPWTQNHYILRPAFVPIFLHQKVTNPNCKHIKTAPNTFIQQSCM